METRREVTLAEPSLDDLFAIYLYLAERIGSSRAKHYVARIEEFCLTLDRFSERGRAREELGVGIRSIVFESQAVILYRVAEDTVDVLRVIHGAQDYDADSLA